MSNRALITAFLRMSVRTEGDYYDAQMALATVHDERFLGLPVETAPPLDLRYDDEELIKRLVDGLPRAERNRIITYLVDNGWGVNQLARRIPLSAGQISRISRGKAAA